MTSINENIFVREWVVLGYFSKRIVNLYLDRRLADALGSLVKTLSSKKHKFAWETLLRSRRLVGNGITIVCPDVSAIVFTKGGCCHLWKQSCLWVADSNAGCPKYLVSC